MLSVIKVNFIVTTALFIIAYILSVFVLNLFKGYLASYLGDNSLEVSKLKSTNLLDHIDFLGIILYVFFKVLIVSFINANDYMIYGRFKRLYALILYFFHFIGGIVIATLILLIGLLIFGNAMQLVVISLFGFDSVNRSVTIMQEISFFLPGYKSFSIVVAMLLGSIVQFNIIIAVWGLILATLKLIRDYYIERKIFQDDVSVYVFTFIATILTVLFFGRFILAGITSSVFNMAIYLANFI